MSSKRPSVYIIFPKAEPACAGAWIDCTQGYSKVLEAVEELARVSNVDTDWEVSASIGWHGLLPENYGLWTMTRLAPLVMQYERPFAAYVEYKDSEDIEEFTSKFVGEYESEEDFALDYWINIGKMSKLEDLGLKRYYIDWEAVAGDLLEKEFYSLYECRDTRYVFRQ